MAKYQILKEYEQNLMHLEDILGSGITNNIQLDSLGHYLFGKKYLGTYSSDTYPRRLKDGEMFIVNNKSSRQKGVHFISVSKYKNKVYAYDTFNRDVHKLSNQWRHKSWINANTNRDQSFNEKNCGSRSMAWLISFANHHDKIIGVV